MTFNGKNNQPRKRSTNNRSLSNRITAIQKEMNPQINLSGMTLAAAKQQFVTRKYVATVTMANSTFAVNSNSLGLVSGTKILKVVAKNLTGRTLTVQIPNNTALMIPNSVGATADNNSFTETKRFASAPLSRFPKITIQVPDLLANPIDVSSADLLFTVGSVIAASTDTVEIIVTARYAL